MRTLYTLLGGFAFLTASLYGQAPKSPAPSATSTAPVKEILLSGTTANVKDSGTAVSIRMFRWSTDEERAALVAAFSAPAPARQGQAPRGQGQGRAAQGQVREQPQGQDQDDAPQPQGAGRGRGGAGAAAPVTPITPFMQALQRAPNLGYLWTNEPTGYSVKYAWRTSQPDGSERVVIITEPRLGAYSPAWTVNAGTATDYGFTLLEFRITAKTAEGKSSLTAKVVADPNTKQLALEDFAAAPAILTKVRLTTK
jgi:hypothetical protein